MDAQDSIDIDAYFREFASSRATADQLNFNADDGAAGACECSGLPSGEQQIGVDALRQGSSWTDLNLTYTFASLDGNKPDPPNATNIGLMNARMQQAVVEILNYMTEIINVTFTNVATTTPNNADIVFRSANMHQTAGYSFFANQNRGNDVTIEEDYTSQMTNTNNAVASLNPGYGGYRIIMHETLGHGFGLDHPFVGGFTLPSNLDNQGYTIMSYTSGSLATNNGPTAPQTLQILDLVAIQHIYGANYNTRSGDTTYTITDDTYRGTRWDGSGNNDTLDLSTVDGNYTNIFGATVTGDTAMRAKIDLRSGLTNTTEVYGANSNPQHVSWNAYGGNQGNDIIENAIGTNYQDTIYGNDLDNSIEGGLGDDIITGFDGDDTLVGGSGEDTVVLSGNFVDYTLTQTSANGADGADTLISIEKLQFDDGEYQFDSESEQWIPLIEVVEPNIDEEEESIIEVVVASPPSAPVAPVIATSSPPTAPVIQAPPPDPPAPPVTPISKIVENISTPTVIKPIEPTDSENDSITGTSENIFYQMKSGDDTFRGSLGDDTVNGNSGKDWLYGGEGNDFILGGRDNDFLQGNQGDDFLNGNKGRDKIRGGKDDDTIHGGQQDDQLFGGKGQDILFGDRNDDLLTGGDDSDIFVFNTSDVLAGHDTIMDFSSEDLIKLMNTDKTAVQVAAEVRIVDGNSVINFEGGGSVTVLDAIIDATDFIF